MKSAKFLMHVEYNGIYTEFGDNDEAFLINPYYDNNFNYYKSVANSIFMFVENRCIDEVDIRNQLIFSNQLRDIETTTFNLSDVIFKIWSCKHFSNTFITNDVSDIGL